MEGFEAFFAVYGDAMAAWAATEAAPMCSVSWERVMADGSSLEFEWRRECIADLSWWAEDDVACAVLLLLLLLPESGDRYWMGIFG